MNEIEIGNLLGEGEFGKVYNCLYKEKNAVLKLFKCKFQHNHNFILNEINISRMGSKSSSVRGHRKHINTFFQVLATNSFVHRLHNVLLSQSPP